MDLYGQLVLCCLLFATEAQKEDDVPMAPKPWRKPFPPQHNISSADLDKPFFTFDGINYDELPTNLKNRSYDCNADFIRCSRAVSYHNPVCVYDMWEHGWFDFASYCEMEYQNCGDTRMKNKRRYHMMGEGHECKYQIRRFFKGNPVVNIKNFLNQLK